MKLTPLALGIALALTLDVCATPAPNAGTIAKASNQIGADPTLTPPINLTAGQLLWACISIRTNVGLTITIDDSTNGSYVVSTAWSHQPGNLPTVSCGVLQNNASTGKPVVTFHTLGVSVTYSAIFVAIDGVATGGGSIGGYANDDTGSVTSFLCPSRTATAANQIQLTAMQLELTPSAMTATNGATKIDEDTSHFLMLEYQLSAGAGAFQNGASFSSADVSCATILFDVGTSTRPNRPLDGPLGGPIT
jgi:hypothetical protein